jgi:hypothetical protein
MLKASFLIYSKFQISFVGICESAHFQSFKMGFARRVAVKHSCAIRFPGNFHFSNVYVFRTGINISMSLDKSFHSCGEIP